MTASAAVAQPEKVRAPSAAARLGIGRIARRILVSLATLLVIAFLTQWGMIMYARVIDGLPVQPLVSAVAAVPATLDYLFNHPSTYTFQRVEVPAVQLVLRLLGRSAVLLTSALLIAIVIGVPLGLVAALRRRGGSSWIALTALLGMSIPSFLLGMLLWVVNIQVHRTFGIKVLPATGYGLDWHILMPALVLATRPLAQIASVTHLTTRSILESDYVRTARAKGLHPWVVLWRHVLRNGLIPILTALVTSLRYSLASLPVVEYFFVWPGVGLTLLAAIQNNNTSLATDLTVSLGFFFMLLSGLLDWAYPYLDPRVLADANRPDTAEPLHIREGLRSVIGWLAGVWSGLISRFRRSKVAGVPEEEIQPAAWTGVDEPLANGRRPSFWSRLRRLNLPLLLGTLGLIALLLLVFMGDGWVANSPYETHDVMTINGQVGVPPFSPSEVFPWGTDMIGRDIQALLLSGARRTLVLAALAVAARMVLGGLLGMAAGWWRGSLFDRLVTASWTVWAAFPVTLFAMIVILALGIQQGMGVFVVGLCIVGWGEIAQYVRGKVVEVKAQPFMEGARIVGAGQIRMLWRHVLPNLADSLIVFSVLEMGAVMLLLAELGFLNIFVGGGFRVMIGEAGRMQPVIVHFSDVPEWSALLSNVRDWWRSYPWMGWYPGLFFFVAILTFNLWGEGLRRFLADTRFSINRLLSRTVVVGGTLAAVGVLWFMRSTSPASQYLPEAQAFDVQRALGHVSALSEFYQGRESGTGGAAAAAMYIADEMRAIGLTPAGAGNDFYQPQGTARPHLVELPRLALLDASGQVLKDFVYRQDFAETIQPFPTYGVGEGQVVGMAVGPDPELPSSNDPYGLNRGDLENLVVLVRKEALERTPLVGMAGALVVTDDPMDLEYKYLFPQLSAYYRYMTSFVTMQDAVPTVFIEEPLAEQILSSTGTSLAQLDRMSEDLAAGEVAFTEPGAPFLVSVRVDQVEDLSERYLTVMGYIPGTGALVPAEGARGLDSKVIMVAAYYDGLGIGPDGTKYPGANDNASGVAAMLELARALKESPVQPKKTVVFVAWAGGDRWESLSVDAVMGGAKGFNTLFVESVIELSGLGAGTGEGLALGQGTAYRLVQLYQDIGARLDLPVTTTGRTTHFGLPTMAPLGGRDAMSAYISWDGSDAGSHLPSDNIQAIDPAKLQAAGEASLLSVYIMSREVEY